MSKTCATCGRSNPSEAYHCFACRSRDFGAASPTADYRVGQKSLDRNRKDVLLSEAIETYNELPGARHARWLLVAAIMFLLIGFMASTGILAKILLVLGFVCLGWLRWIVWVDSARRDLSRLQSKVRQSGYGTFEQ
jgi:hypothetical protein